MATDSDNGGRGRFEVPEWGYRVRKNREEFSMDFISGSDMMAAYYQDNPTSEVTIIYGWPDTYTTDS